MSHITVSKWLINVHSHSLNKYLLRVVAKTFNCLSTSFSPVSIARGLLANKHVLPQNIVLFCIRLYILFSVLFCIYYIKSFRLYFPTSLSTRCSPVIHKWPEAYKQKHHSVVSVNLPWEVAPTCPLLPSYPFLHPAARNSDATILDHAIRVTYSGNKIEGTRGPAVSAPSA